MKKIFAFAAVALLAVSGAHAQTFDISGVNSWEFEGDPLNETLEWDLGSAGTITSVDWDVNLTTLGISWAEESSFRITTSEGSTDVFTPGFGDDFGVTNQNYVGGSGPISLADDDGIVSIEFFEIEFNDNFADIDSFYEQGSSITVGFTAIPEPASAVVLAVAALGLVRRRR